MALRAGSIIERARLSHPAFTRQVAPTSVAVELLSRAERTLFQEAHRENPFWATATFTVALRPDDDVADVGAGEGAGEPLVRGTTTLERVRENAGTLALASPLATVLVSPRLATIAGAASVGAAGASWTVDFYVGQVAEVVDGPGAGQRRVILSNTADTLVVDQPWAEPVEAGVSLFRVVQALSTADGEAGVVLGESPAEGVRSGWLVKLDASGNPFLDLASPIQVPLSLGIPLPPCYYLNPQGIARRRGIPRGDGRVETFSLLPPPEVLSPGRSFTGYVQAGKLYLARPWTQWRAIEALELTYLPIPPQLTAAGDPLLMPESGEDALVTAVAAAMGRRATALGAMAGPGDLQALEAEATRAMAAWMFHVAGAGRATAGSITEVW